MIVGRYSSYVVNPCQQPVNGSKYWRYTASSHGKQVTGYGLDCAAARRDWERLNDRGQTRLPPAQGGTGGGLSGNSVQQAKGNPVYQPKVVKGNWVTGTPSKNGGLSANSVKQAQAKGSSNTPASIFSPIFGTGGKSSVGAGAGGSAGAGIGASINASVSGLNQAVSNVLPDSIEDKLPEGMPLWMLPVGIVGAGLLLILLVRKR